MTFIVLLAPVVMAIGLWLIMRGGDPTPDHPTREGSG
jgi:hypothetical protein